MSLTAEQEAAYQVVPYRVHAYAYIALPGKVFEARVAGAQVTKTVTQIEYSSVESGSIANVREGYTVTLGTNSSGRDLGVGRVRGTDSGSSLILTGRHPYGKGLVGHLYPDTDAYMAVWNWNDRRAWSKNPFIDTDGTQFKDETAYSSGIVQPPVANAGPDVLVILDDSNESFTVDCDALASATPSFATASGASLASVLWESFGGGSITTGMDTDTAVTFTFAGAGSYEIDLTVEDTNGNPHTAHRWVVGALRSQCIPVVIRQDDWRIGGGSLQLEVERDVDLPFGSYPPGTRIMVAHRENSGDAIDGNNTKFSGWLGSEGLESGRDNRGKLKHGTRFECYDLAQMMRLLPLFSLSIRTGTGDWYQLPSANLDVMVHHMLHWHSNVLDLCDFKWSGTGSTYALPQLATSGGNFWDQGHRLANAIRYALTFNSKRQLRMIGDPMLLPTADEASSYSLPVSRTTTVVREITEADYSAIRWTTNQFPRYHWSWRKTIKVSTDASQINTLYSVAPSKTPGVGPSADDGGDELAISQNEANVVAGHRYTARLNAVRSYVEVDLKRPGWVYEPADMQWVQLTLPAEFASQRGYTFTQTRALVVEVRNRYDSRRKTKKTTLVLEIEAEGVPAETHVPDPAPAAYNFADYVNPGTLVSPPSLTLDNPFGLYNLTLGTVDLIAFNKDGYLYEFRGFPSAGGPTVTRVSLVTAGMSGTLRGAVVDPWSPAYIQTGVNINGWIVTTTHAYRFQYNPSTSAITLDRTLAIGTTVTYREIATERAVQNFVCFASYTSGGTILHYSTDGGVSWNNQTITTFTDGAYNTDGWSPPIYVSAHTAGLVYVGAFQASNNGTLYSVDTYGAGTPTQVSSGLFSQTTGHYVHFPYADNDATYYYVRATGTNQNYTYRNGSLVITGGDIVFHSVRGIHMMDSNSNVGVIAGVKEVDQNGIVLITNNRWATWTEIQSPTSNYFRGHCAAYNNIYLWGASGAMGLWNGSVIVDKRGNIPTDYPSAGEFVNIMGVA